MNNEVWSCGRGVDIGSQSCTVINDASGEVFAQYALPWDKLTTLKVSSDGNIVISSDVGSSSEIFRCRQKKAHMECVVKEFNTVAFTTSSYIPFTYQVVLVGAHDSKAVVSFADSMLSLIQSYKYTSPGVTMTLRGIYSVPDFVGTFVAGTCTGGVGTSNSNYVMFGWIRSHTGVMIATYLAPFSSNIVSGTDLVSTVTAETTEPDTFIGGALQLSDNAGSNAYIVRVNALYQSVLFGMRYRYVVDSTRRVLSDATSIFASAVRGMVLVDSALYILVQTIHRNSSSASVLKANAASGAIHRQAHLSVPGGAIICSHIVRARSALAMGCTVHSASVDVQSVVISVGLDLLFTKLPTEVALSTDTRFKAESVLFTAHPFKVIASSVFLRATQSELNSTSDSYSRAYASTITPTNAPIITPTLRPSARPSCTPSCAPLPSSLPSSVPSSRPSSSPSAAPSISPQPTSQPSTSGPTNTYKPTVAPTEVPTQRPSLTPSVRPSMRPSVITTMQPSAQFLLQPSVQPSMEPSIQPGPVPSTKPSLKPSTGTSKTQRPTTADSSEPTEIPSAAPTSITNESRGAIPPYVIGSAVAGLIALCVIGLYVYARNKKRYSKVKLPKLPTPVWKKWTLFRPAPVSTKLVYRPEYADLAEDGYYHPSYQVPVVDMSVPERQDSTKMHKSRVSNASVQSLSTKSALSTSARYPVNNVAECDALEPSLTSSLYSFHSEYLESFSGDSSVTGSHSSMYSISLESEGSSAYSV